MPRDQTTNSARAQALAAAFRIETTPVNYVTQMCRIDGLLMMISRAGFATILPLGLLLMGIAQIQPARAQYVGRESDIVNLRLGQRVLVDDGTCPAGQVKQVSGSKMMPTGIVSTRKCIPRLGPKKKQ